ncbi:MAG: phosphoethanolamine transferase [Prevotella koreensis]|uniref:phosphoethanolamine transferase n=1 Tax=Prevotella koreensis TaxID=2490854 RepID=UPI003FA153AF
MKLSALKYFFEVTSDDFNVQSCDLYLVLDISILIMLSLGLFNKPLFLKKGLKTLWYIILTLSFVIRKFLLYEFGMDFSPAVFSLISETNPTESNGFLETFVFNFVGLRYLGLFFLIILSIIVVEILWKKLRKKRFKVRLNRRVMGLCFYFVGIYLCIMSVFNIMQVGYLEKTSSQNTASGLYFAYLHFSKNKVYSHKFLSDMSYYYKTPAETNKDSLNLVFVVGESFIKSHAQVYGYFLPTMPYMQKEVEKGNLFVFKDLISSFNGTTRSLMNALCLNVLSDGKEWYESCYWPLLMKKTGYNVYMWDNQKEGDKRIQGAFHEMYAPSIIRLCYTKTNAKSSQWDDFIVKNFEEENIDLSALNFVYFHLQGQHVPFNYRYPKERAKFAPKHYNRKESWITNDILKSISDYDNSILYNDYVLHLITDCFRNTNAIVVFVSDHGEEVYDYRNKEGRTAMDENDKSNFAHSQYDIPFLVWISDKVKQRNPELCECLASSVEKPYSLDRIGHFIIGMAGIKTKYYSAEDDILSSQFKAKDRYIYLPGQNRKLNYEQIK